MKSNEHIICLDHIIKYNYNLYNISVDRYQLNTEAGFLIARKGIASLTSVGPQVQALIAVTTDKRYRDLQVVLRDICATFRVSKLNSGIFTTN